MQVFILLDETVRSVCRGHEPPVAVGHVVSPPPSSPNSVLSIDSLLITCASLHLAARASEKTNTERIAAQTAPQHVIGSDWGIQLLGEKIVL